MEVKANDQLHVSSVKAGTIAKGEKFEVGDAEGKQLLEKGLVTKVASTPSAAASSVRKPAAKKPAAKKAATPKNKMSAKPANKAAK